MSGASGRTLGGVQRKAFVPNVNARRNKKQSTDDPLAKLLHADTAEPVLPTLPTSAAASRPTAAAPKRTSPRLTGQGSPRPKPVAAPSPKAARPIVAGSSLKPAVIRPPSRGAQPDPLAADDDGIEGMDLDAPDALLPPAAATPADETAWLLQPNPNPNPNPNHNRNIECNRNPNPNPNPNANANPNPNQVAPARRAPRAAAPVEAEAAQGGRRLRQVTC